MPAAPDPAPGPAQALTQALAQDRGRILAALWARTRDFQLAEEALQDATEAALIHWTRADIPQNPLAWLIRVAFRKAIDRLRAQSRAKAHADAMAVLARDEAGDDPEDIPDERLRLIFTCCHPALEPKSRVALTLRMIGGLTTAEIADAFLDVEPTMGQRIARAKAKITAARIPYVVPGPEDWDDRLQSVLAVVYLIFNAGYTEGVTRDLCDEAVFLARLLNRLRPEDAEIEGCLALLLLTHARRRARIGPDGASVPPQAQERALWDRPMLAEGMALVTQGFARGGLGPFRIKAAIAALHAAPIKTDWHEVLQSYDRLLVFEPTPVVRLNRAVAMAEVGDPARALSELDSLAGELDAYQPYLAARAFVLGRLGRKSESLAVFDRAIAMAATSADALLLGKLRDDAAL